MKRKRRYCAVRYVATQWEIVGFVRWGTIGLSVKRQGMASGKVQHCGAASGDPPTQLACSGVRRP